MPLQSAFRTFGKMHRLSLLGGLVCGWSLFICAAWWLVDSAGHTITGGQELLQIGALPVT
jgi:hypothetical protein